jgi:hypothetical protein
VPSDNSIDYARSNRGRGLVHKTYTNQSMTHCGNAEKIGLIAMTLGEAAAYLSEHRDRLCQRCFGKVAPYEVRNYKPAS